MRLYGVILCLLPVLTFGTVPAHAQQGSVAPNREMVQSPILTIDSDRFFYESAFGLRVARDVEKQGSALAAENRKIEADLETEELQLTAQRAVLSPESFRQLADAFDEKVQEIRATQSTKSRALNQLVDQEREVFLNGAGPVLEKLMRDARAAVILERLSVFVSSNAIDITNDAIARINASLGSGKN